MEMDCESAYDGAGNGCRLDRELENIIDKKAKVVLGFTVLRDESNHSTLGG